jgi:hypothetical protein
MLFCYALKIITLFIKLCIQVSFFFQGGYSIEDHRPQKTSDAITWIFLIEVIRTYVNIYSGSKDLNGINQATFTKITFLEDF